MKIDIQTFHAYPIMYPKNFCATCIQNINTIYAIFCKKHIFVLLTNAC